MPIGANFPRIGKMVRIFDSFLRIFYQHIWGFHCCMELDCCTPCALTLDLFFIPSDEDVQLQNLDSALTGIYFY